MTDRRRELLDRLEKVQHNQHVDIMTITGFMNEEQLAKHVARYESEALGRMFAKPAPRQRVA